MLPPPPSAPSTPRTKSPTGAGTGRSFENARGNPPGRRSSGAGQLHCQVHFLDRSQGDRQAVSLGGPDLPGGRWIAGDDDSLAMGLSWPAGALVRHLPRALGRSDHSRHLSEHLHDARADHDFLCDHARDDRLLREFHHSAADRRAGHGVPQVEPVVVLDLCCFPGADRRLLFVQLGTAGAGWTTYAPLSTGVGTPGAGQTLVVAAIFVTGAATIMGGINYVTTVIRLRAPGMTYMRMPLTVWGLWLTAILNVLFVPVLGAAAILLILDRSFGTQFFIAGAAGVKG